METKETTETIATQNPTPIYIAGPMTGLPEHNVPAFNAMEEQLLKEGWTNIINPAKHFDGDLTLDWHVYLAYDLQALSHCGAIVFLDGWKNSKGAKFEYLWGSVFEYHMFDEEGEPIEADNRYLPKAKKLVEGDRAKAYGEPIFDFLRTAQMMEQFFGFKDISPLMVPMILAFVKISRECHKPKEDNLIDFCGYLLCFRKTLKAMNAVKKHMGEDVVEDNGNEAIVD